MPVDRPNDPTGGGVQVAATLRALAAPQLALSLSLSLEVLAVAT